MKTACNLAAVSPTKYCLRPSCFLRDSTSDGIVVIMQLLNVAARMPKVANNFETSSNSLVRGLYCWSYPSQGKT